MLVKRRIYESYGILAELPLKSQVMNIKNLNLYRFSVRKKTSGKFQVENQSQLRNRRCPGLFANGKWGDTNLLAKFISLVRKCDAEKSEGPINSSLRKWKESPTSLQFSTVLLPSFTYFLVSRVLTLLH